MAEESRNVVDASLRERNGLRDLAGVRERIAYSVSAKGVHSQKVYGWCLT
jgi:hypothetical protein